MNESVDGRISDLEWRLEQYHERLVEAIAERDRLALNAAWGVQGALVTTITSIVAISLFSRLVGWGSWILDLFFAIGLAVVELWIGTRSNNERCKELDKLAHLPEWGGTGPNR